MDTGQLQIAAGTAQTASTIGTFANAQRSASAIVAQSDFEAKLAALQATDAVQRGSEAAERERIQTETAVGSAKARLAASGVTVGTGSAARVVEQDSTLGALDQQMIRNNAAREAFGYKANAELNQLGARQRAAAIRAQSYDTLLTGAAKDYGLFPKRKLLQPTTSDVDSGGDNQDSV